MKAAFFLLTVSLATAITLEVSIAEAWGGWGRGSRERTPRYSSECNDALANSAYQRQQVDAYSNLYNSATCGDNIACKYQQAQALQYSIQQAQKAESRRARDCND